MLRSSYNELRRVTGDFHEGILTLRGRVSSFYLKQVAQTLVQHLEGVERIVNRVEVTGPAPTS
ncbi:MAG: BON domain-containing protein [Pirellulaceae bacterium]|jgi:osmotically-inducible protein OsmY|nr:BON domain-containing protein [Pirellulaceae bacterium]